MINLPQIRERSDLVAVLVSFEYMSRFPRNARLRDQKQIALRDAATTHQELQEQPSSREREAYCTDLRSALSGAALSP